MLIPSSKEEEVLQKILMSLLLLQQLTLACTIISAVDSSGTTSVANNEDSRPSFDPVMHWEEATDTTMSYLYFTYEGIKGEGSRFIQGGMNEAGLFFDWNWVPYSSYKNQHNTIPFSNIDWHLPLHILKNARTVPEVFELFKQYKLNGIESGQMHLADREGNLGVVNADTMYLQKGSLITTNFRANLVEKQSSCDRFKRAKSLLTKATPSLDKMITLSLATQGKGKYITLYSNIHNLSTGEIQIYYLGDTAHSYRTTLQKLVREGSGKSPVHDLFPNHPVVTLKRIIATEGAEKALSLLQQFPDSLQINYSSVLCRALLKSKKDLTALPIMEELFKRKKEISSTEQHIFWKALYLSGEKKRALSLIREHLQKSPDDQMSRSLLRYMEQIHPANVNCTVFLPGYENAPYVLVEGLSWSGPLFLHKVDGGWQGVFHLQPGHYEYRYFVAGVGHVFDKRKRTNSGNNGHRHVMRIKRKKWKEVSLPEEELIEYCGTYRMDEKTTLIITEKHGVLQMKENEYQAFAIYPAKKDLFFVKDFEASMTFLREDSGQIEALMVHHYDDIYCKRIK